MPHFHMSAEDTIIDEIVDIELHDLASHSLITIRAQFTDDSGYIWASHAQFHSDTSGKISLKSARPITGTYQQPDSMGLFWSMQLQATDNAPTFQRPRINPLNPIKVQITTEAAGEQIASATLIQRFLQTDISALEVREDGLVADLFVPANRRPKTTVLVFGGSGGGFTWSQHVAAVLASHGCAAMAIAYFHWDGEFGLPDQFTELPLKPLPWRINS